MRTFQSDRNHNAMLFEPLSDLLANGGANEVGLVLVGSGPGSYSGTRVGIAAAQGVAFGGGFQILSGAGIRFVHPETRCAIMEMKWGLVPDMAGFPLWRGNVRDDVIRELTYTNREFSGVEAHGFGFATHVTETPLEDALALAKVIANKHPQAMRGAKTLCNEMQHVSDADLLRAESREQVKVMRTPNQIEAVMASMQKRKPVFVD